MDDNPKPHRRWFQFSLRTFLVMTMLIGFGCAWVGMQLEQRRRHAAVVKEIVKSGGRVHVLTDGDVPAWKEWLFGSYAVKPVFLYLEDTDATDSFLSQTQGMNLYSVDLRSTKVTDAGLTHLKGLTSLERLCLCDTEVTDEVLAHLKGFPSLNYLELGDNQITDTGLAHLKGLSSLYHLELGNTQLTDERLIHLKGMTSLSYLDISDNQITDAGLTHLKKLTSLRWLHLGNTQVTDACVDRLQQSIPGCQIRYPPLDLEPPSRSSSPATQD